MDSEIYNSIFCAAVTELPRLSNLRKAKIYFLTVLQAEKSKVKA
jgi:hypothetical protein